MHIGLTYDLRDEYLAAGFSEEETAEFDRVGTIDAIDGALVKLGHETTRIGHARQLIDRLAAGEQWDLVFNICEGMHGLGREAQVPAILDVYNIAYTFADPLVMSVCLHKGLTKLVVRDAGLATPKFLVVERIEDLEPHLHCFFTLAIDEARDQAARLEKGLATGEPAGPLCGVPVSIKDQYFTAGLRTTGGS